jgi:4,5-dihydroxyphthalate decarboxylase
VSDRPLRLTFAAVHNYDRTGPLLDGRNPEGIELVPTAMDAVDLFDRVARADEFDIAEMSASTYVAQLARGDRRYVALPVFTSRMFRHSFIFVNRDAGIREPADLLGKPVGTPDYFATAGLWQRGVLEDYGVPAAGMDWYVGSLEGPASPWPPFLEPRPPFEVHRAPGPLDEMLASGRVAAVFGYRIVPSFKRRAPGIERLFPDYHAEERAYLARTGIFPIMHVILLRRAIHEREPWVAGRLFAAFEEVRRHGVDRLHDTTSLAVAVPWLHWAVEEAEAELGPDYWSYGIEKNRAALEYLMEQSYRQGMSPRRVELAEAFVDLP